MKPISNPHDRYFRAAMSEPSVARNFFEVYLPQEIKELVDFESLQICQESYIDEKLKLQIADLLFSVNFSGCPGYLYLLTEHQSTADPLMPLRLWKYILAIMEQHVKEVKEKTLPIVYPMIYYNGRTSYNYSTCFFDLFREYKDFAKSILLQSFQLIDLTKIADEELRQHIWEGIMGSVMKHILVRDMLPYIKGIMPLFRQIEKMGGNRYIEITFSYLLQAGEVSEKIIETFVEELSPQIGEKLMTTAEWLKEQGRAEGINQGINQGIQKGIIQGIGQNQRDVAVKLLHIGMDINQIAQVTELSLEEIKNLKQKIVSREWLCD